MDQKPSSVRTRRRLFVYVFIVGMLAFPLGWDVGTLGNLVDLPSFRARYQVPSHWVGLVLATFNLGCVAGCVALAATRFSQKIGCLASFRACFAVYLASACILMGALVPASGLWVLLVGRFVAGTACGLLCAVAPVYVSHLCTLVPGDERLLSMHPVMVCGSILAGNLVFAAGPLRAEIVVPSVQVGVAVAALVALVFLPSSPRDTLHDVQLLRPALRKLLRSAELDPVFPVALALLKKAPLEAALRATGRARVMAVCVLLLVFQQFTGINFFFYYGRVLFDSVVRGEIARNYSLVLLSLTNLVGAVASSVTLVFWGTRPLLLAGLVLLELLLIAFSTLGIAASDQQSPTAGYAMLLCACGFILTFATTWGPCVNIAATQISEACPEVFSCGVTCGWLANLAVLTVTPVLIDHISYAVGYIFAVFTACLGIFVWWFLPRPETREEERGVVRGPQSSTKS